MAYCKETSMNRNDWKFAYTADVLLKAAKAKHAFHTGRHKWWSEKRETTKALIKSEGIEIDESLAAGDSDKFGGGMSAALLNSTYGRAPSVNIRNDLVADLNECNSKIMEHRNKTNDYSGWIEVLESQGSASLMCHQDDWLFFFGKL